METEFKEIISYSSIQNNIDLSSNFKITNNNIENEEIDFPFKDRDLHDNSVKFDNQSYQSYDINNKKNLKTSYKSECFMSLSQKNIDDYSTNKEIVINDNFEIEESKLNYLLTNINNKNQGNDKTLNKQNIKENNVICIKSSYKGINIEDKEENNNYNINRSLKLKEKERNNEVDFESICNSRGDMNSFDLTEQKQYFNNNIEEFNLDLNSRSQNVKKFETNILINDHCKKREEKFEVLANTVYKKNKLSKNNNEGYSDKENNKDYLIQNKIKSKHKEYTNEKKNILRSKSNKKFEYDLNNKRSPFGKKEPILKNEDFKKNFLKNNIDKINFDKNNEKIINQDQTQINNPNNNFIGNEKILSPKTKSNSNFSYMISNFKLNKEAQPEIEDNKIHTNIKKNKTNFKQITNFEKNRHISKNKDENEKINTTKRAFSEKRNNQTNIKTNTFEKAENINLNKEENNKICNDVENIEDSDKLVRKILKNRNNEYLKNLEMKLKNKQFENQEKLKKEEDISKKIKENLGLNNVKSKLLEPKKEIEDEILDKKLKNKSINKINKLKTIRKKSNTPLTQETTEDTLEYDENEENNNKNDKDLKNLSENNKFCNSSSHLNTMKNLSKKNFKKLDNSLLQNNNYNSKEDENSEIKKHKKANSSESTEKRPVRSIRSQRLQDKEKQEKKKIDPDELKEKMQQQLEKEKIIIQERILKLKNCYTLEDWKRRNRVENDKNVFVCFNGYPDMRKALLDRGWVENVDPTSNFYDFKYALSSRNIDYNSIQKNQYVNHFEKNAELTRKVLLSKNLKNLIWFRNVDVNTFFPRCYDLNDAIETECLADDFKVTKAQSLLKKYLYDFENISLDKVKVAITVLERKLKSLAEILDSEKVFI